jgi:hypothetical protein
MIVRETLYRRLDAVFADISELQNRLVVPQHVLQARLDEIKEEAGCVLRQLVPQPTDSVPELHGRLDAVIVEIRKLHEQLVQGENNHGIHKNSF